jgi:tetratricopeptide (TPR) repeat protein
MVAHLNPALARADDADPDLLIMRGLDLRRAGRSADALALFRRAYEVAPSPRTLGQMGLVESSLQLWVDAEVHLCAALATPNDAWVHRNRQFLDQARDRTKEHVGELVITGPPGTRVSLGKEGDRLAPSGGAPAVGRRGHRDQRHV